MAILCSLQQLTCAPPPAPWLSQTYEELIKDILDETNLTLEKAGIALDFGSAVPLLTDKYIELVRPQLNAWVGRINESLKREARGEGNETETMVRRIGWKVPWGAYRHSLMLLFATGSPRHGQAPRHVSTQRCVYYCT